MTSTLCCVSLRVQRHKCFARQNLGAGRIHFARAREITLGAECRKRHAAQKEATVFFRKLSLLFGGGGGSRTPVRKHFLRNFSGRRRFFAFPCHDASRHAAWLSSFICHAGGKAYPGHVHHSGHAQAQLVVLLGWTAAIKQRREQSCCCSLIYKVPVLRMSGTSARYSCPHVPVETSTPP